MKVWIVVLALLLLVGLIFRERYQNYEEALKDVGQTAGYITPTCESGFTLTEDKSNCEKTKEDGTKETKAPTCPSGSSYVKHENRGVCEPTGEPSGGATSEATSEATGGASGDVPPTCPDGYTFNSNSAACEKTYEDGRIERVTGTCPTGRTFNDVGLCSQGTNQEVSPTVRRSVSGRGSTFMPTATVGGGSSGNLIGPTSGGVGKTGKNVWGPIFTGLGQASGDGGDSTKTNQYPGLLGGMMGKQSTRMDGVGIVSPSQPGLIGSGGFGLDMGVLPSSSSLGTDANARFLPFSRPGADAGFTADPYRLAKGYSTKNYSPENEPVPFLTDFSAFFK